MKLIDVDSKATLEDFLTLKKRLNLYSFYGNVMKKSVVTRMSLHYTFQKVNYVTCSLVLWKYRFGVICTNMLQIQRKIC
jgi:hypothetical protein